MKGWLWGGGNSPDECKLELEEVAGPTRPKINSLRRPLILNRREKGEETKFRCKLYSKCAFDLTLTIKSYDKQYSVFS